MTKTVSQRRFIRGLNASTPVFEQPPGTVPRVSNLILSKRGGFKIADGSLIISASGGVVLTGDAPWTELFLFQPVNVNRYYIGIKKSYTTMLSAPAGLAAVDGGAGGSLTPLQQYFYKVTALDGAGGETTGSNEATFTEGAASHKVNLTWGAVTNATGYNVYRSTTTGNEVILSTNVSTNAFTDDGSLTPGSTSVPTNNTTQQCLFYKIPGTSYTGANILETLPADNIFPEDGTPGGGGGGGGGPAGGGTGSAGAPPTSSGGVSGNISPIPLIVQFANKAILALGNGVPPQTFTDPSTVANITNTFTAVYPNWITATLFNAGDQIQPTVNNAGNFVFKASQGGTSGGANPNFPQTQGQTVADGKIIWVNQGVTSSSPAPRGAAHAIVYSGSLWLLNTSPTTTADQLDGPTVLKMSDLNNPNSWNPLNTAFIGKDDGTQGMGMATFSISAEGIAPTGSLVVFKEFSTYQIIGVFGAPNFSIQAAQTDMGCIAPRSIQFLPGFGIARLTHLGVAIFDGIRDRLISEEIRQYVFGGEPDIIPLDWNFAFFSKGAQSANPPMYTLAIPTQLQSLASFGITVGTSANLSGWTGAPVWIKITQFTNTSGVIAETGITPEFNIPANTLTSSRGLFIQSAQPNSPNTVKWRIYVGYSPGGENTYVETNDIFNSGLGVKFLSPPVTSGAPSLGTGALNRILCYDLVLKAWTIIDLPWGIGVLKQVRAAGTTPITVTGGFNDGTVRRIQAGDSTWDGTPVAWNLRSAEVFGKNANERIYFRRLTIRGSYSISPITINAVISIDNADQQSLPLKVYTQGVVSGRTYFEAILDTNYNSTNTHVTLSGSGDIEVYSFDWELVPLKEGVPVTIR